MHITHDYRAEQYKLRQNVCARLTGTTGLERRKAVWAARQQLDCANLLAFKN